MMIFTDHFGYAEKAKQIRKARYQIKFECMLIRLPIIMGGFSRHLKMWNNAFLSGGVISSKQQLIRGTDKERIMPNKFGLSNQEIMLRVSNDINKDPTAKETSDALYEFAKRQIK